MKRWHDDVRVMLRQAAVWELSNVWTGSWPGRQRPARPLGHYRKRHALDCGKTDCCVCHSDKVMKIKSHKQMLADQETAEQIRDYYDQHAA